MADINFNEAPANKAGETINNIFSIHGEPQSFNEAPDNKAGEADAMPPFFAPDVKFQ